MLTLIVTLAAGATLAGAGYLGSLAAEMLHDDLYSQTVRWRQVAADALIGCVSLCGIVTALYSLAHSLF